MLSLFAFATPAQAASTQKFWVENESGYKIIHVYVQSDSSGGQRDLLGKNGVIPPWDLALTLRPISSTCNSKVGIVAYDESDDTESWVWFRDVNICSKNTSLTVEYDDFVKWQ